MNESGIVDLVPTEVRREWGRNGLYPNATVFQLFLQHVERHPTKKAVLAPDESISYVDLLDCSLRLAAGLRLQGIVAGDVVAYQLTNSWRCCAIDLAVAALGAVVAPFPPGRGRLDIESLLRRCDARAVVVPAEFAGIDLCELIESLRPTLLSVRIPIVEGGEPPPGWSSLDQLMKTEPFEIEALPTVCPDSPVRLLVSSGTESEPKLVAYSHNALLGGRGRFLQRLHVSGHDFRGLYLVPLGSAFGSTATFGSLSWLGGSIVVLPTFDVSAAIQVIERFRPTHILGVPTMFQRIAADPALAEVDRSSLVSLVSGGALIDDASVRRCTEAFGCGFISLYGSADGVNCHNTLDDTSSVVGSVGRPNPSVCEIRIVDDQGTELPQGEIGEIEARGPLSPMQYVNAPELDMCYRDADGWVRTGDLGCIDCDGYLVLAGRKKDIIIRGGVNISPVVIERLATSHPDVVSAACVAVPDTDMGQRLCICVTLRNGAPRFSLQELTDFLLGQGLEVHKLPEYLRFYRQLPLSPAGKVDKKQLATEVSCLERRVGADI